jgi:putative oxidoreductase
VLTLPLLARERILMDMAEIALLAARVTTGGAFLVIGLRNIAHRRAIAEMLRANGFPFPLLLAACGLALQIILGALMVSGYALAVAAAGLLVFTVLATLMAHSFWTFKGEERAAQVNAFLANMIMAGGLLALLAAGLQAL